jgi:hypothetical protein
VEGGTEVGGSDSSTEDTIVDVEGPSGSGVKDVCDAADEVVGNGSSESSTEDTTVDVGGSSNWEVEDGGSTVDEMLRDI